MIGFTVTENVFVVRWLGNAWSLTETEIVTVPTASGAGSIVMEPVLPPEYVTAGFGTIVGSLDEAVRPKV